MIASANQKKKKKSYIQSLFKLVLPHDATIGLWTTTMIFQVCHYQLYHLVFREQKVTKFGNVAVPTLRNEHQAVFKKTLL